MASLKTFGIAVGAGLAAGLLFAASAKGTALAVVIIWIAPLPIMIATLGFTRSAGAIAAAVATAIVAVLLGMLPGAFFGVLLGFPAWWIAYLALLARPVVEHAAAPAPATPALKWYPIGRVVTWAALLVAAVVLAFGAATLMHFGGYDATVTALTAHLKAILTESEAERPLADQAGMAVRFLPSLLASSTLLMLLINLWLAGRVVQGSSLLSRPWPPLPENLRLPRAAAFLVIMTAALAFLGGAAGTAAGVIMAPLGTGFVLQGLGTAHALTRGLAARRLILFAIYFITLSLVPSLVALAVLGVVDCLTPLRRRGTPTPSPSN